VSSNGPDVIPDNPAVPETPRTKPEVMDTEPPNRLNRVRSLGMLGGLIAGLAAFGLGEATHKLIPAEKVQINAMGRIMNAPTGATQAVANTRNAAIAFGLLGMCLGGCLGIAGGQARRVLSGTIAAGLLGSILGAALLAGSSMASINFFANAQINYVDYDLFISMAMHGLIWGLAGAAAGLAFAVGLGQPRLLARATVAGFAGAVIGAIAFDLIGAGLFPLAETGEPISTTWPSRLTARLLVCLTTAVLVILTVPAPSPAGAGGRSDPTRAGEADSAL
jgi:hypothetical protein